MMTRMQMRKMTKTRLRRASPLTAVQLAPKRAPRRPTAPSTGACSSTSRNPEARQRRLQSRSPSRHAPALQRGEPRCGSTPRTAATAALPKSREPRPQHPRWMPQTPELCPAPWLVAPAQKPTSHALRLLALRHHPTPHRSSVGGRVQQKRVAQPVRLPTAAPTEVSPRSREPPSQRPQWMPWMPALARVPWPVAPVPKPKSHALQPLAFRLRPNPHRSSAGATTSPKRVVLHVTPPTAAPMAALPTSREPPRWTLRTHATSRAPSPDALAQMPMNRAAPKPRSHALRPAASLRHQTPHRSLAGVTTLAKREAQPAALRMAVNAANPMSRAARQA